MRLDRSKIPKGPYCYDKNGRCPYWRTRNGYDEQENGYCEFLGYGDWEINETEELTIQYHKSKKLIGVKTVGHKIGIPVGLLWDQCKECGINEEDDE